MKSNLRIYTPDMVPFKRPFEDSKDITLNPIKIINEYNRVNNINNSKKIHYGVQIFLNSIVNDLKINEDEIFNVIDNILSDNEYNKKISNKINELSILNVPKLKDITVCDIREFTRYMNQIDEIVICFIGQMVRPSMLEEKIRLNYFPEIYNYYTSNRLSITPIIKSKEKELFTNDLDNKLSQYNKRITQELTQDFIVKLVLGKLMPIIAEIGDDLRKMISTLTNEINKTKTNVEVFEAKRDELNKALYCVSGLVEEFYKLYKNINYFIAHHAIMLKNMDRLAKNDEFQDFCIFIGKNNENVSLEDGSYDIIFKIISDMCGNAIQASSYYNSIEENMAFIKEDHKKSFERINKK